MKAFEIYETEAKEKWGNTAAYQQYEEKAKNHSHQKWNALSEGMDSIMAQFGLCMKNGAAPDDPKAQDLVKMLQNYITENYYTCTNEILAGLGQMYIADARFQTNIDKHAAGTAAFISEAISAYCRK